MDLKPGDSVSIHAYKHNGNLYRAWERATVFHNDEDMLILINENVIVTEVNGRHWKTSEPAVWFFFKKSWYNIICMFKQHGINYYCNISSPYLVEGDTIKYIDYDLDVKVFNDGSYKILDLKEFNRNRITWKYPRELVERVWEAAEELKVKVKQKQGEFDHSYVQDIFCRYKEQK